jgi:hypothetical protein
MRGTAEVALQGLQVGAALFGVTVAALGGASAALVVAFWAAGVVVTVVRRSRQAPVHQPLFAPLRRRRTA